MVVQDNGDHAEDFDRLARISEYLENEEFATNAASSFRVSPSSYDGERDRKLDAMNNPVVGNAATANQALRAGWDEFKNQMCFRWGLKIAAPTAANQVTAAVPASCAAGGACDRQSAVALRVELHEPARLEPARNEDDVGSREHAMHQRLARPAEVHRVALRLLDGRGFPPAVAGLNVDSTFGAPS